jgi:hypothetical protein
VIIKRSKRKDQKVRGGRKQKMERRESERKEQNRKIE